jgi:hypothetical protein
VTGADSSETATGTQIVQAAANLRIKQKAKNLSIELVRPAAAQWLELYRQHLTNPAEDVQDVRVDDDRTPTGYSFVEVGPEHVQANVEVIPVDGSTEPDNLPQKRLDATQLVSALSPFVDKLDTTKLLKHVLVQYGVDRPDDWISEAPDPEEIVQAIGEVLADQGVPPEFINQVLQAALQRVQEVPPADEQTAAPQEAAPIPAGGQ